MSKPNEKEEWLNQTITITVTNEHGNELYRKYGLRDGQLPDFMQRELQDIVDTLLDTSYILESSILLPDLQDVETLLDTSEL